MVDRRTDTMATVVSMTFLLVPSDVRVSASVWLQASGRDALVRLTDGRWCGLGTFNRNWVAYGNYIYLYIYNRGYLAVMTGHFVIPEPTFGGQFLMRGHCTKIPQQAWCWCLH